MPSYFLAKSDPQEYSLEDLERDGRTEWDGVRNAQAARAIKEMRPGDKVFFYHSGGVSAIVGLATVDSEPYPDPEDSKSWIAAFAFQTRIDPPVTLREIKATGKFSDWALVRQSRLSTMPAPREFVAWMRKQRPNQGI